MVHCDGLQFDLPNCVQAYEFIFIDDYTDFKVIYPVSSKADFITVLQAYQALAFFYHKTYIKVLRMDNAAEMASEEVYDFCRFNGIHIQRCTPYEHHQNGKAERAVRTIEECALTMLHHAGLSVPLFINYALTNAVQLRNKCPTKASLSKNSTPYELFTGRGPCIKDCHPIGEVCFAYVRKEQRKVKYDPKAKKCLYLCEDYERKAHLLMDVQTRAVIAARDVRFPRLGASVIFPSALSPLSAANTEEGDTRASSTSSDELSVLESSSSTRSADRHDVTDETVELTITNSNSADGQSIIELASALAKDYPSYRDVAAPPTPLLLDAEEGGNIILTYPDPSTLTDVLPEPTIVPDPTMESVPSSPVSVDASGSSSSSLALPRLRTKNSRYFNSEFSTCTVVCGIDTPTSYRQAMLSPQKCQWEKAVQAELDSLHRQATWDVVPRSESMYVVQCKWVFRVKTNERGDVERFKARLVARGFTQTEGVDYGDTYSPVLQTSSRRLIYCLSALPDMKSIQADVETAFLQSEMDRIIYLQAPPGLDVPQSHVLLLRKALYGLKQSPLLWFCTARSFFLEIGFVQLISDPCLFILNNAMGLLILSIYVDDISLTSSSDELIEWVLCQTRERFPIRDVKPLSWLLGMNIETGKDVVQVSQQAYIENLLEKFEVDSRQCANIPMNTDISTLELSTSDVLQSRTSYQSLVGSLNYLAHASRPDILFATNTLSRFLIAPRQDHYNAGVRIVRYLNSTKHLSISYINSLQAKEKGMRCGLYSYCDTSFPNKESSDGYPTSGYFVFFYGNLIAYKSSRESVVCLSTMEAELLAMANAVTTLQHIQGVLMELGFAEEKFSIITDSIPAVKYLHADAYSSNPRTRHLTLRFHFLRSLLRNGTLLLETVSSKDQWADMLTKALPRSSFEALRRNVIS
tara:strand:+ start:1620 stop:4382 length:2763 start_codon:yes stop_codon:yes gene_type:complete